MTRWKQTNAGIVLSTKILAVCMVVIITAFVIAASIPDTEGTASNDVGGSITYHLGDGVYMVDQGGDVASTATSEKLYSLDKDGKTVITSLPGDTAVKLSTYFGMKSTEYSTEFWTGWGEVPNYHVDDGTAYGIPNWVGPLTNVKWASIPVTINIASQTKAVTVNLPDGLKCNGQSMITIPAGTTSMDVSLDFDGGVNALFGGWIESIGSADIIYPGEIVPFSVEDLYANWIEPDLYVPKTITLEVVTEDGKLVADGADLRPQSHALLTKDASGRICKDNLATYNCKYGSSDVTEVSVKSDSKLPKGYEIWNGANGVVSTGNELVSANHWNEFVVLVDPDASAAINGNTVIRVSSTGVITYETGVPGDSKIGVGWKIWNDTDSGENSDVDTNQHNNFLVLVASGYSSNITGYTLLEITKSMFSSIYWLSSNTIYYMEDTNDLPAGTYRTGDPYVLYSKSTRNERLDYKATITIKECGGSGKRYNMLDADMIIDNVNVATSYKQNSHGGSEEGSLFANGHRLIMGTNITSKVFENSRSIPAQFDRVDYGLNVYGGGPNGKNVTTAIETSKEMIFNDSTDTTCEVDIGTFLIIHSGVYGNAAGGGLGNVGANNNYLSTYIVLKDCIIIDTASASGLGNSYGNVYGAENKDNLTVANKAKSNNEKILVLVDPSYSSSLSGYTVITISSSGAISFQNDVSGETIVSSIEGGSWKIWNGNASTSTTVSANAYNGFLVLVDTGYSNSLTNYTVIKISGDRNITFETNIAGNTKLDAGWKIWNGQNSGRSKTDGGSFMYLLGMFSIADYWQDSESGYIDGDSTFVTGKDNPVGGNTRLYIRNQQSSVIQGGALKGHTYGSSHVFVSGDTSVWDIMAGGRDAASITDYAYMEITGKSEVRRAACGTITDGSKNNNACVGTAHLYVGGDAKIATVYGAGFDTWMYPSGVSMKNGEVHVEITGGHIGDVFGGGYRGSIGDPNNPGTVTVYVDVSGGHIDGNVYGGGSGGLNKIKHYYNTGEGFQNTSDGKTGNKGSTGRSYVYGDVNVCITGGEVTGSVYGGGMSVPKLKSYNNTDVADNDFTYETDPSGKPCEVATVIGDINIFVGGNARVGGSVYGAGKGIEFTTDGEVDASKYGFNRVVYRDGKIHEMKWVNTTGYTYDDSVDYSGYAKVKGNVTLSVGNSWNVGGSIIDGEYTVNDADADAGHNIVMNSASAVPGKYTVVMVNGIDVWMVEGKKVGDKVPLPAGVWKVNGAAASNPYTVSASDSDGGNNIVLYTGDVPAKYRALLVNRGNVTMEVLDPGEAVLSTSTIQQSVYGGGAFSKVNGNTLVRVGTSTVKVNVFGGGLGTVGNESTNGNRVVFVFGGAYIMGSVYGGSQNGYDGKYYSDEDYENPEKAEEIKKSMNKVRSTVVVQKGTIDGSVFGGGLMGRTYGHTGVYIGYYLPNDKATNPVPNQYPEQSVTMISLDSVFAGGNISTGSDEKVTDAYTKPLVMGDGSVFVYGDIASAVSIAGSIMGSGNACLTRGTATIELVNFYDVKELAGIHRADKLTIDNCNLKINGRNPITKVFGQDKLVSIYKMGELVLKNNSSIAILSPIDDVDKFKSLTSDGNATTMSSPQNRIVFMNGPTVYLRTEGLDKQPVYKESVEGYTLMVSTQGNYGAYVLGRESDKGGFSVTSDGSFREADTSVTNDVCCWYISGIQRKITTMTLLVSEDGKLESDESTVKITKFQSDTQIMFTGGIFTKMSNNPNGDPYTFVRPGAETMEYDPEELGLAIGYDKGDGDEENITLYDPTQRMMAIGNETVMTNHQATFFKKDGLESDISGAYRDRSLTSVPMEYSSAGRTSGEFNINLCLSGRPLNDTSYVGYVTLNFQEVKILDEEGGGSGDTPRALVAETIEIRVDIYISSEKSKDTFMVEIRTDPGDDQKRSGQSSTLFPPSYSMDELSVLGVDYVYAGSGYMPKEKAGTSYVLPTDCKYIAPEGKTFAGWYVQIGDGGAWMEYLPGDTVNDINANVTIKPKWTTSLAVIFDPADSISGAMSSVSMERGTVYKLPECTYGAPAVHTFAYWQVTIGSSKAVEKYPNETIVIEGDTVIKPIWGLTKTVTFDKGAGEGSRSPEYVAENERYVLPYQDGFTAPSGFYFLRWDVSIGGAAAIAKYPGDSVKASNNITVTAIWSNSTTFTVFFNGNGSESVGPGNATVAEGAKFRLPSGDSYDAPADNLHFLCWSVKVGNGIEHEYEEGDLVSITADTWVMPMWASKAQVTFANGGGSGTMSPKYFGYGASYLVDHCSFTPPNGEIFSYWKDSKNNKYFPGQVITIYNGLDLTAVYEDEDQDERIVFYSGGGSGYMPVLERASGVTTYTLPNCDYSAGEGKVFSHWSVSGNNYQPGDSIVISLAKNTVIMINYEGIIKFQTNVPDDTVISDIQGGTWKIWNGDALTSTTVSENAHNGFLVLVDEGYSSSLLQNTVIKIQGASSVSYVTDVADNTVLEPGWKLWNGNVISTSDDEVGEEDHEDFLVLCDRDTFVTAVWDVASGTDRTITVKENGATNPFATYKVKNDHKYVDPKDKEQKTATSDVNIELGTGSYVMGFTNGIDATGKVIVRAETNQDNTTGWSNTGGDVVFNLKSWGFPLGGTQYVGTLLGNIVGNVTFAVEDMRFYDSDGEVFYPTLKINFQRGANIAHTILTFEDKKSYTVSFIDHGLETRRTYVENTLLTRENCESPTRSNFSGWYLDSGYVNRYDYNMVVNDESDGMRLYARYTYMVTLDNMNGTTYKLNVSQEENGALIGESDLPTPTYTGYDFMGWYKDKDYVYKWDFLSDRVKEDQTLYAKWLGKDVRVYFWYKDEDNLLRLFEDGGYEIIFGTNIADYEVPNTIRKDEGQIISLDTEKTWYICRGYNNLIPAGSEYTVSTNDLLVGNKIVLLALSSNELSKNTIVFDTKYGSGHTITSSSINLNGYQPSYGDNGNLLKWRVVTGTVKDVAKDTTYSPQDADATNGIIILHAIWEEINFDLSRAYQLNADRNTYPTVRYGSTFDVKDPLHDGNLSILDYAEQTINFSGSFVKWTVKSPKDSNKHVGIYQDTVMGSKILKYVTDDMIKEYDDIWNYYEVNNGGYPRIAWPADGSKGEKPTTMEIHLMAETTKVAIKVSMGLNPKEQDYASTVTIDDPEEFLVYPNGPDTENPVADSPTKYHGEYDIFVKATDSKGKTYYYVDGDDSVWYYYDEVNGCFYCIDAPANMGTYSIKYRNVGPNNATMDEYGNAFYSGWHADYRLKTIAYTVEDGIEKEYLLVWWTDGSNHSGGPIKEVYPLSSSSSSSVRVYGNQKIPADTDITHYYLKDVNGTKYRIVSVDSLGESTAEKELKRVHVEPLEGHYYEFKYKLNNAVRNGYSLTGWHNEYIAFRNAVNPSADLIRTVHMWTDSYGYVTAGKLITADASGGHVDTPFIVGDYVVDPNDADAEGKIVLKPVTQPSDERELTKFTVTIKGNTTDVVSNKSVDENITINTLPGEHAGMQFKGWKVRDRILSGNEYNVQSSDADVHGNILIVAEFEYIYTVNLKNGTSPVDSVSGLVVGDTVSLGVLEAANKTFIGWKTKSGIYEDIYTVLAVDEQSNKTIELSAVWNTDLNVNTYTIDFITEHGSAPSSATEKNVDDSITLNTLSASGYEHTGWRIISGDNQRIVKGSYVVVDDDANVQKHIILEAMWSVKYEVIFFEDNISDDTHLTEGWKKWNSTASSENDTVGANDYSGFLVLVDVNNPIVLSNNTVFKISGSGDISYETGVGDSTLIGTGWMIWNSTASDNDDIVGDYDNSGFLVLVDSDFHGSLTQNTVLKIGIKAKAGDSVRLSYSTYSKWRVADDLIVKGGKAAPDTNVVVASITNNSYTLDGTWYLDGVAKTSVSSSDQDGWHNIVLYKNVPSTYRVIMVDGKDVWVLAGKSSGDRIPLEGTWYLKGTAKTRAYVVDTSHADKGKNIVLYRYVPSDYKVIMLDGKDAEPFTMHYMANWVPIDYNASVSQPTNGAIDVYLEDRENPGVNVYMTDQEVEDFAFRFGDKMKLSYSPSRSGVAFVKWVISGQYIISDIYDPEATLIVQGDCSIAVDESTGSVVDIMITFDAGNLAPQDRIYTRVYMHEKLTDEYYEAKYIPGLVGMEHYTVKVPYGDNYELVLGYGWSTPGIGGQSQKLPSFEKEEDRYVLKGNLSVVVGDAPSFMFDVITAGLIDNIGGDITDVVDTEYKELTSLPEDQYNYLFDKFIVLVDKDVSLTKYTVVTITSDSKANVYTDLDKGWTKEGSWKVWNEGAAGNYTLKEDDLFRNFIVLVDKDVTISNYTVIEIDKSSGETNIQST